MPSRAVHTNILDEICGRIKWLERAIFQLRNKRVRTIPIYDKDHLPHDMPDGMLFFTSDSEQFGIVIDGTIYYAETDPHAL